jgi:TM2 domain-containing membrane protein YozV
MTVPSPYMAPAQYPPKSLLAAYVLWFFLGAFGVQHFYLGKVGRGLLYLFTLGVFGIGILVDLFTLPAQTRAVNAQRAVGIR